MSDAIRKQFEETEKELWKIVLTVYPGTGNEKDFAIAKAAWNAAVRKCANEAYHYGPDAIESRGIENTILQHLIDE